MSDVVDGPADDREEVALQRIARIRPRLHPPPNEIPGVLPLGHVLGRSETVVAVLLEIHAYSTGLDFHLTYRGRGGRSHDHPPFVPTNPGLAARLGVPAASAPRVTIVLADGTPAVTLERVRAFERMDDLTDQLVLVSSGGCGNDERLDAHFWLTPHPRADVVVHFAWPEQQHEETSLTIDALQLEKAGATALSLWPWDPTDVFGRP